MIKNILYILLTLVCCENILAQAGLPPIPDLISISKRSAVPVICHDKSWPKDSLVTGTAVILGQQTETVLKICALTCEHVIAIKDSLRKTKDFVSDIFVLMNKNDGTSVVVKAEPAHTDEESDFAILKLVQDPVF